MEESEQIVSPLPVAGPPEIPTAPVEKLDDFPDRFSPMLVKELRQGLRTYTFVIVFLALQAILTFVLCATGAVGGSSHSEAAGEIASKVIFCFYAVSYTHLTLPTKRIV